MVRSVPNGERSQLLEEVYNFRTDFPENYCSWFSTDVLIFFATSYFSSSAERESGRETGAKN